MATKNCTVQNIASQKGKVVIITGANIGLGYETARVLAEKQAHVVLISRDPKKGKDAVASIKKQNPSAEVEFIILDLLDFGSVKSFSKAFHSKFKRLDILINNVGIMYPKQCQLSKQGFESQLATNHLGHFLLKELLLDLIKATPNAG